MRKGVHNLIFGLILIFMQLIVYFQGGFGLENSGDPVWDLGSFIGYNLIGIFGLILLNYYFKNKKQIKDK